MVERSGTEELRRRNLAAVLGAAHRHGPLTRAALTSRSGLTRSTIGALVGELAGLDLVYETDSGAARVGRPSPLVHANERVVALAVNPDVDAVTVGIVGLGGKVHRRIRYQTQAIPSLTEAVNITRAVVEGLSVELAGFDHIAGAGLAIPGLVNAASGQVRLAPHLGWSDVDVVEPFQRALDLPTVAANDATLGTQAESIFGAAAGYDHALYLNGSASGIGGGAIVNGMPLTGASGYAGEFGHMVIRPDGTPCHCGRRGCLETEVNLERLLGVLNLEQADADQLEEALSSDGSLPAAREVRRQTDMLSIALSNLVNAFNPQAIVLGGFLGVLLAAGGNRLAEAVRREPVGGLGSEVRVERAALGSELLLVGAAEAVFAELLAEPRVIRRASA
ncbi:ROK family protein [Arthrobacter sp. JZ12]|uniref:ROK family transcriptional regulator n=1 Tax=Arthrobacter sp. JZ12 TaxID=2654190 RepID=UPI002B47BA1D|nr:ROK family transcriptional regulator [Arthrobacter sp. JZ12]WRH26024.1 ROK family protein [Arthrobacter sp. JZ12]